MNHYIIPGLISNKVLEMIVRDVFRIDDDLKTSSRKREMVESRMVMMFIERLTTTKSLAAIGKAYNRDHATVIQAIKKVKIYYQHDDRFKINVDKVIAFMPACENTRQLIREELNN